jgi:simple sugar transport system permease protein
MSATPASSLAEAHNASWQLRWLLMFGAGLGYAVGLTALLALTFLALGVSPQAGLLALWQGAFGDAESGRWYAISETFVKTAPLLLTGLGVLVAWRAGLFSIGGEGQLLMGAAAGTAVGLYAKSLPGPLLTLLVLSVSAGAGALWAGIAGWLRVRRNVQEVISTIMLNYVALNLLGWLVRGPLQERARVNPQSDALPDAALFARVIPPDWANGIVTRLHSGVFLALIFALVVFIYLFYTSNGFGLRVLGQNADAARVARFPVGRLRMQAMLISGALCGLAGAVELLGVTGRLSADFSSGWGYTAIPVALLGGLHPMGVIFSAFFFGALTAGSGNLARFSGVSSVLINVIQAASVLAVVGVRAWKNRTAASETD